MLFRITKSFRYEATFADSGGSRIKRSSLEPVSGFKGISIQDEGTRAIGKNYRFSDLKAKTAPSRGLRFRFSRHRTSRTAVPPLSTALFAPRSSFFFRHAVFSSPAPPPHSLIPAVTHGAAGRKSAAGERRKVFRKGYTSRADVNIGRRSRYLRYRGNVPRARGWRGTTSGVTGRSPQVAQACDFIITLYIPRIIVIIGAEGGKGDSRGNAEMSAGVNGYRRDNSRLIKSH